MKKERLQQYQRHAMILDRLKNGETLSITQLANEWGVLKKTLQRDFKKLMEGNYGIVRAEDGKRFVLASRQNTSQDAQTAIRLLDSLSSDIGGEFYTKAQAALHKIQKYIESPFYTRIDVENISGKLDLIEELEYAISEQRFISFAYRKGGDPQNSKRHEGVKPHKIIIFNGFWYLFCEMQSRKKTVYPKFYLKDIYDLDVSDKSFTANPKMASRLNRAINIYFEPGSEPYEVSLLLEGPIVKYFERKPIRDQFLKKNSDGTAELSFAITSDEELFSFIKPWIPYMKIIEPDGLQERFDEMLKSYLER